MLSFIMAHDTAKKNYRSNITRLRNFIYITITINTAYAIYSIYMLYVAPIAYGLIYVLIELLFWVITELIAIYIIFLHSKPILKGNTGTYCLSHLILSTNESELIKNIVSCTDISNPSQLGAITSTAQDCLWISWAIQLCIMIISRKAIYFYVIIILLILYTAIKLLGSIFKLLSNI